MRKRIIYIVILAALITGFYLLTPYRRVMTVISDATLVIKQFICQLCSVFPFSAAEALVVISIIAIIMFIVFSIVAVAKAKRHGYTFFRRFTFLVAAVLSVYFLLCLFLNASYHADSFQDKSGISVSQSTVDDLYEVTAFFVGKLSETYGSVSRGKDGQFDVTNKKIFDESTSLYGGVEKLYPFLDMKDIKPKPIVFSRLMSRFNYTGFYFPFTGEANINTDVTSSMIPATVAHEMAHQRGIASEQEANFLAVLACSLSGNADYEYSGWLFGFINLGNALYQSDSKRYHELASLLPEDVKKDIRDNNDYWAKFETPEAKVSEKVYDSFLKGNGQELGVQSYGAVVDLLIAWYKQGGFTSETP